MALKEPAQQTTLLARFGLGQRLDRPVEDAAAALERELSERIVADPCDFDPSLPTAAQALRQLAGYQEFAVRKAAAAEAERLAAAREAAMRAPGPVGPVKPPPAPPAPQAVILQAEVAARLKAGLALDGGFTERLVWFWSNHFAVARRKSGVTVTAGAFEREAIRPHVLGRFRDMLGAAIKHQAMLLYLDAEQSVGPASKAGRRRGRGLNENLARELLELHTLGARGGYAQDDVVALAKVLTGWSVVTAQDEDGELGEVRFNPNRHEPGAKTLLGATIEEDGPAELEQALDRLAAHPATARHVATKLAASFVGDQPPPDLVARLAGAFRDSGGDLALLARTLLMSPEARAATPGKLRTAPELVLALLRAGVPADGNAALHAMRVLGHDLWNPPAPNGFPDTEADLVTPVGMKARLELAANWAHRMPLSVGPVVACEQLVNASRETRLAVAQAESRAQAFAILFAAPEFQRR